MLIQQLPLSCLLSYWCPDIGEAHVAKSLRAPAQCSTPKTFNHSLTFASKIPAIAKLRRSAYYARWSSALGLSKIALYTLPTNSVREEGAYFEEAANTENVDCDEVDCSIANSVGNIDNGRQSNFTDGPIADNELSNLFVVEDATLVVSNKDTEVVEIDQGFWNLSQVGFLMRKMLRVSN